MPHADRLTGEFDYIDWVRRQTHTTAATLIGIGDDAAALRPTPGRDLLVTTDMILEGVHFDLGRASPRLVGRKAMAVNLSDIAAMAGVPVAAVVSVGLPRGMTRANAEQVYAGLRELADQFNVALVGGDTNASPSGLVICVTLIGETTRLGPVRRSGAKPGDWVMATGSFGGSILGAHLEFTPRVREALVLHERYDAHAMIDVSDGLAADLGHIATESRCGAAIETAAVPISDAARLLATEAARQPLELALHDGEDFELLFTLSPDAGQRLIAEQPLGVPVSRLGEMVAEQGLWLADASGARRPLEPRGYDHFRS
jgi:thiamine-monophosphate kinase